MGGYGKRLNVTAHQTTEKQCYACRDPNLRPMGKLPVGAKVREGRAGVGDMHFCNQMLCNNLHFSTVPLYEKHLIDSFPVSNILH